MPALRILFKLHIRLQQSIQFFVLVVYTANGEFLKYTASCPGVVKFIVSKSAPAVTCLPSCELASTRIDILARIM